MTFIIEGLPDKILFIFYERPTTMPNYIINQIEAELLKRGVLEDYTDETVTEVTEQDSEPMSG